MRIMRGEKGYITEKIFDCFFPGVIPIYWGAENVTDYIPQDTFIDRRNLKQTGSCANTLIKSPRKNITSM